MGWIEITDSTRRNLIGLPGSHIARLLIDGASVDLQATKGKQWLKRTRRAIECCAAN